MVVGVNAIERLREAAHAADGEWDGYDGSGVHGYDPESTCPVCVAVAAVDALYQSAAPLGDYDLNAVTWPVGGQEWRGIRDIDLQSLVRRLEALAAAVRRVEGEA